MMPLTLQVLVTQRCNAICDYCDKAVGIAKLPDLEMTEEAMGRYVDEANNQNVRITVCDLSGGEPVMNRELQGIINQANRFKYLDKGRVYSNGLHRTQDARDRIDLPDDRWAWRVSPLDDLDDPLSGKNKPGVRYRDRVHVPFFVSPVDLGLEATFENCTVRKHCGRGLDVNGWSMCGQAPILGRMLNIDPYHKQGTVLEKVNQGIDEICRHCRYGLGKPDKKIVDHYEGGISPTFREALEGDPRHDFKPLVQLSHR